MCLILAINCVSELEIDAIMVYNSVKIAVIGADINYIAAI